MRRPLLALALTALPLVGLGQETTRFVRGDEIPEVTRWTAQTIETKEGPNNTMALRVRITIRNGTWREFSSVTLRLVVDSPTGRWQSERLRATTFQNTYFPFKGAMLPASDSETEVAVSIPKSRYGTGAPEDFLLQDAEEVVKPDLHDLGHFYTRMRRDDARTLIPILKRDPSLVKLKNDSGLTTTLAAFAVADRETVKWILAHGGDRTAKTTDGYTALHVTMANPKGDLFDLAGGDPDVPSKIGTTPLMRAVFMGNETGWAWLLKHGADASHTDTLGNPVAKYAIVRGFPRALAALVKARADPLKMDARGYGWMHYTEGNIWMINAVQSYGVPIDQRGPGGMTPLMFCVCSHYHEAAVSAWLVRGADPRLKDESGHDSFFLARDYKAIKGEWFERMVAKYPKGGRPLIGLPPLPASELRGGKS